jgi:uncharacterized protein
VSRRCVTANAYSVIPAGVRPILDCMDAPRFGHEDDNHASVGLANEILRSATGAVVHGGAIPVIDMDLQTGIYVEPHSRASRRPPGRGGYLTQVRPENATLRRRPEVLGTGLTTSTSMRPPTGGRTPSDTTLTHDDDVLLALYSLRRYLAMSAGGNPRMLVPLFAPEESLLVITELGRELRAMRVSFLSRQTVRQFLGYMDCALSAATGGSERRFPEVAEQTATYGWDVASGSRALCLAYQIREIASTLHLTLPLPPEQRRRLLAINRGEVPRDEVSAEISACTRETQDLVDGDRTPLPHTARVDAISTWAADAEARYRRGDVHGG